MGQKGAKRAKKILLDPDSGFWGLLIFDQKRELKPKKKYMWQNGHKS
jgi:hypothetical protein